MLHVTSKYEETIDTEELKVKDQNINATVYVLAGQKHRRDATWADPLRAYPNNPLC